MSFPIKIDYYSKLIRFIFNINNDPPLYCMSTAKYFFYYYYYINNMIHYTKHIIKTMACSPPIQNPTMSLLVS